MEEPYSESESTFRLLVENSLTGIYINLEGRIIFANRRFAGIFGYTRGQVIGMHYLDFVHPEDRSRVEEIHNKRLNREAAPAEYESRGLTRQGRTVWIKRRNVRIDYKGKPAILGNMVDITQQKRLREQLLHMEKLASLGTFTEGVAHELNNPLNNISSSLQIILEEWESGEDRFKKSLLHDIEHQVERGRKIINALFDFSRTEGFDPKPVNFRGLVDEAMKTIGRRMPGSISLDIQVPDEIRAVLSYEHIKQVLVNLVLNALHAMEEDEGGKLCICAYHDPAENSFCFEVKDTGRGIEPEALNNIFDPFYTTKDPSKGAGLGLSITHGMVRQHGGKIDVSSRPGMGTTFTVSIPEP